VHLKFCTNNKAFPPFYRWRNSQFFTHDPYQRIWYPHAGVEDRVIDTLRTFTKVVDRAALNTRPPVVEIIHDIPLDAVSAGVYRQLDAGDVAGAVATRLAKGLLPGSELAIVGKLMQVLSGAVYDNEGTWRHLHDRRLDALAEIHAAHRRPTLVYFNYRHEADRIRQRFPFAQELRPGLIDLWNAGQIELLLAHPASAGHGINLQHGSDTLLWFSLPWSAELFQQANARLARQGQGSTVNIHILISAGRIDEIALRVDVSIPDGGTKELDLTLPAPRAKSWLNPRWMTPSHSAAPALRLAASVRSPRRTLAPAAAMALAEASERASPRT